ncbi:MAG: hypothetical protein Q4E69_06600 [Bacilli bacterium]|nr:hypothetical protein [Bacilli bacterium]
MYDNDVINNFYVDGNNNTIDSDMSTDTNMNSMNNSMMAQPKMMSAPITEGVQTKCIHRTIVHDVPHVCPIHTRIINHHVYRHTYQPRYTCSEENTISNVQCGSCCNYN